MIAQALAGYSIAHLAMMAIIVAAVVAIAVIVIQRMGVPIPPWVIQILWVIALAVLGILAIKVVVSLI